MEWETQQQQQHAPPPPTAFGAEVEDGTVGSSLFVKVMTDEQLEILRTQIAVYSAICEQLVDMHKAVTAQQDLAGVRMGNPYCDPYVTSIGGHKITARQRWTPTPIQLQKLERIFDQGMGTPSKQKIKEITSELSQHGQISETNVYNWFQNRRARSKRKQQNNNNNAASSNHTHEQQQDVEADAESPKDKKTKPAENFQNSLEDQSYYHSHHEMMRSGSSIDGINGQLLQSNKMEPVFEPDHEGNAPKPLTPPCQSFGQQQLSFMESMMETQRFDHLIGKMEVVPQSYSSLYHSGQDYSMTG